MVPFLGAIKGKSIAFYSLSKDPSLLFKDYFNRLFVRKNRNHHIYFHNLSGFDGIFLLRSLINQGYEIDPKINDGRLISIEVTRPKRERDVWTINDSYLILLSCIKSLSETFLKKERKGIFPYYLKDIDYKGDFPSYDFFDKHSLTLEEYTKEKEAFLAKASNNAKAGIWNFKLEALKYCYQDTKILYEILMKFNTYIFTKYNLHLNNYPTLPSLAFAIYRSKYLKSAPLKQIVGRIRDDIKLSYTGGATDMYIPTGGGPIYAYDVNSLYPYVMSNFKMPVGNPIYFEGDILRHNPHAFGFFYCKVTTPEFLNHPIIQTHYKTSEGIRTVAPLGTWEDMVFSEEIKNAMKLGYKFDIKWGYTFKADFTFKAFVEDLYKIRLSYPKSDPMNFIAKIILNSLYGRFGMDDNFIYNYIVSKADYPKFIKQNGTEDSILDIIELGDNYLIQLRNPQVELNTRLDNSSETHNVNIAIASAITAYARIHMSQFKNNPNLPNLYYTDTDSVYFDGPLPDTYIDPKRLGALKLEGIWNKAVFLAPKVYGLANNQEEIVKIKGLSKQSIKEANINVDLLSSLLDKDKVLEFKQSKWFKDLSTANIKIKEQIYSLKVTGNKRKLVYVNDKLIDTCPFNISE
jgi:hypothetical protein